MHRPPPLTQSSIRPASVNPSGQQQTRPPAPPAPHFGLSSYPTPTTGQISYPGLYSKPADHHYRQAEIGSDPMRRQPDLKKRPSLLSDFHLSHSSTGGVSSTGSLTYSASDYLSARHESGSRRSSELDVPTYAPQVENISPTPDDQGEDKAGIVSRLQKVEHEIAVVEREVQKLQKKKTDLEESTVLANAAADAIATSPDGQALKIEILPPTAPKSQNLFEKIYAENRKKAESAHAKAAHFDPPLGVVPVYQQPWDTKLFEDLRRRHEEFKPRLILYLKKMQLAKQIREKYLTEQYDKQMEEWKKKMERYERHPKRIAKEQRNREIFEKTFPELKKNREEKERSNRMDGRSCMLGSNDVSYDNSISFQEEDEVSKMRQNAVLPPMMLDERSRKRCRYINNNNFVRDPVAEHQFRLDLFKMSWTDEEKTMFRQKFVQYGKNFAAIAAFLDRKSTKDCVQYYYLTKKRENYKQLMRRQYRRRGKPYKPPQMPRIDIGDGNDGECVPINSSEDVGHQRVEVVHFCIECKSKIDVNNPGRVLTRSCYEQYGLDPSDPSAQDAKICLKCRVTTKVGNASGVRRKSVPCPVGACTNLKRRIKARCFPTKWFDLSQDQRKIVAAEFLIDESTNRCCGSCFKRIDRRVDVLLAQAANLGAEFQFKQENWNDDEIQRLKEGVSMNGTSNWDAIAVCVQTKCADDCRQFFICLEKNNSSPLDAKRTKVLGQVPGIEEEEEEEGANSDDDDNMPPSSVDNSRVPSPSKDKSTRDVLCAGTLPNDEDVGVESTLMIDEEGQLINEERKKSQDDDSSATLSADEGQCESTDNKNISREHSDVKFIKHGAAAFDDDQKYMKIKPAPSSSSAVSLNNIPICRQRMPYKPKSMQIHRVEEEIRMAARIVDHKPINETLQPSFINHPFLGTGQQLSGATQLISSQLMSQQPPSKQNAPPPPVKSEIRPIDSRNTESPLQILKIVTKPQKPPHQQITHQQSQQIGINQQNAAASVALQQQTSRGSLTRGTPLVTPPLEHRQLTAVAEQQRPSSDLARTMREDANGGRASSVDVLKESRAPSLDSAARRTPFEAQQQRYTPQQAAQLQFEQQQQMAAALMHQQQMLQQQQQHQQQQAVANAIYSQILNSMPPQQQQQLLKDYQTSLQLGGASNEQSDSQAASAAAANFDAVQQAYLQQRCQQQMAVFEQQKQYLDQQRAAAVAAEQQKQRQQQLMLAAAYAEQNRMVELEKRLVENRLREQQHAAAVREREMQEFAEFQRRAPTNLPPTGEQQQKMLLEQQKQMVAEQQQKMLIEQHQKMLIEQQKIQRPQQMIGRQTPAAAASPLTYHQQQQQMIEAYKQQQQQFINKSALAQMAAPALYQRVSPLIMGPATTSPVPQLVIKNEPAKTPVSEPNFGEQQSMGTAVTRQSIIQHASSAATMKDSQDMLNFGGQNLRKSENFPTKAAMKDFSAHSGKTISGGMSRDANLPMHQVRMPPEPAHQHKMSPQPAHQNLKQMQQEQAIRQVMQQQNLIRQVIREPHPQPSTVSGEPAHQSQQQAVREPAHQSRHLPQPQIDVQKMIQKEYQQANLQQQQQHTKVPRPHFAPAAATQPHILPQTVGILPPVSTSVADVVNAVATLGGGSSTLFSTAKSVSSRTVVPSASPQLVKPVISAVTSDVQASKLKKPTDTALGVVRTSVAGISIKSGGINVSTPQATPLFISNPNIQANPTAAVGCMISSMIQKQFEAEKVEETKNASEKQRKLPPTSLVVQQLEKISPRLTETAVNLTLDARKTPPNFIQRIDDVIRCTFQNKQPPDEEKSASQFVAHQTLPQPAHQNLPQSAHQDLPQSAHQSLPQSAHQNLPQSVYQNLPQPAHQSLTPPAAHQGVVSGHHSIPHPSMAAPAHQNMGLTPEHQSFTARHQTPLPTAHLSLGHESLPQQAQPCLPSQQNVSLPPANVNLAVKTSPPAASLELEPVTPPEPERTGPSFTFVSEESSNPPFRMGKPIVSAFEYDLEPVSPPEQPTMDFTGATSTEVSLDGQTPMQQWPPPSAVRDISPDLTPVPQAATPSFVAFNVFTLPTVAATPTSLAWTPTGAVQQQNLDDNESTRAVAALIENENLQDDTPTPAMYGKPAANAVGPTYENLSDDES